MSRGDIGYDEEGIALRVRALTHAQQVAFALSCAERLLPNYVAFVRRHGWGNPEVLRRGLDLAWEWLDNGTNAADLTEMRAMCEAQAPDTHDFDSVYVSPALDAANSAASVFDLIESRDPARAIEIAYWARDSVDMYVQEIDGMEPNTIDLEKRIAEHPLMRREIDRQRGDLGVVRQEQHPSRLRERFRAPRHGNLETTQSP